jgi:hypothetical protein
VAIVVYFFAGVGVLATIVGTVAAIWLFRALRRLAIDLGLTIDA